MHDTAGHYHAVAKTLHWLMAILIVWMLVLGVLMTTGDILDGSQKLAALHVHESLGMIVLGLGLIRLSWRLSHRPPPFLSMPRWESLAAFAVHALLYGLLIVVPLVGWMIISTMPHNALFFGLFEIPNLPVLPHLPDRKGAREILENIHWTLAWIVAGLIVLHVGAALKHHFADRDDVLMRMTPRCLERSLRFVRGG